MVQRVLSQKLKTQYESIRELLQQCLDLTEKCSDFETSKVLRDRLSHLQSAALFVIVGEVKAGKSSFVNALLGEDICEVAPDPCTAVIQELVYGEERTKTVLGDNWERVCLPKDVLQEITIVDTPGTNSVIRNHQTITENYIPRSDLVVFVFPAKNPHTGTAWEFLTHVRKEWHRKMVFVLQQADLATQGELAVNIERVKQYARERNVQDPIVFSVSAKRESEKASDSGFTEFRQFLRNAVETGEVWQIKVEGARDTAKKIASDLLTRLRREKDAIADDRTFYEELIARVESRRDKTSTLRRLAVDSLCVTYDRLSRKLEEDFKAGLAVETVLRRAIPIIRDKDVKTWLAELKDNFASVAKQEIDIDSARVSKDISDEMESMFKELTEAISHRETSLSGIFTPKYSDREQILLRLQAQLQNLRISDIVDGTIIKNTQLGPQTLAGGGIAALGAVLALATHMVVIDFTGGILALCGAGLIAVTLLWKRSSIINEFSRKMDESRNDFRSRLDQEISQIFNKLFMEVDYRLKEPVKNLVLNNEKLTPLIDDAQRVLEKAEATIK